MGWGRMLLLGDWGQQVDIGDVQRQLGAMRQQIRDLRQAGMTADPLTAVDQQQAEQIRALQRENEQLELCVHSLARLLHDKGIVSRQELQALAAQIDKTP